MKEGSAVGVVLDTRAKRTDCAMGRRRHLEENEGISGVSHAPLFLHNIERWSAESWWRLFLKSGLGLFSCNPRFVFFPVLPRASSRLWPAAPVLRSLPSSLPTGRLLRQAILNQLKQHHWPLHANSFQKNAPSSTHSRLRHPTTTPPSLHESRLIVASTRHARGVLHSSSA
jgi:hypothetical protein